jgi:hypothetical protein
LCSYRRLEVSVGQHAWVATPEKALLDLIYLESGGNDPTYLASLRLQALDRVDLATLEALAQSGGPKLQQAARAIAALARVEAEEYESL